MSVNFRCHGCGACCLAVGDILNSDLSDVEEEFREDVQNFPHGVDEKGWCEKLDVETMQCTVYDNRPLLCRVDAHYNGRLGDKQSREEYHAETELACKYLMKTKLGMSDEEIEEVYATLSS